MTLATLFGMFHVVFEQAPDRLEAKVPPFVVHAGSVTRGHSSLASGSICRPSYRDPQRCDRILRPTVSVRAT